MHQEIATMHRNLLLFGLGALYAFSFAFTIPITTVLAITFGVLYGFWGGLVLIVTATIVGALGAFFFAQYVAKDACIFTLGAAFETFLEQARKHPISFLLSTRFLPLVPFPVAHFVPAIARVRVFDFLWTTLAGTIPAAIAFVAIGTELRVYAMGTHESHFWLTIGLGGLSLSVLTAILWRRLVQKEKAACEKSSP
jgi:uncharacterized membrane protein YdjX (TVP38/TMEM64 family)